MFSNTLRFLSSRYVNYQVLYFTHFYNEPHVL
jgi:hypothetical protein